jgi:hypothetical protein
MEPGSETRAFLPDYRLCHGARPLAPNAGEEFACGNLRPETEAVSGFPACRGERLAARPFDMAADARI